MLPVGALIPLDRLAVCCAQLDDFEWEVPDCVPGMLLSEQDSDVEWMELTQDVLPDVFPVVSAVVAAVPWPLPAIAVSVPRLSWPHAYPDSVECVCHRSYKLQTVGAKPLLALFSHLI